MTSGLRERIFTAITELNDPQFRIVVGLLYEVLDTFSSQLEQAFGGNMADHQDHHRWIADRIKNGGQCDWSLQRMSAEEEDRNILAADKRSARDTVIRWAVTGVLSLLSALAAYHLK